MDSITIEPTERFDVLTNPGMGWTTSNGFKGEGQCGVGDYEFDNTKYPPSSMAYFPLYWEELEPEEGNYNWDLIEDLLENARRHGQKLVYRIVTEDGNRLRWPGWPKEKYTMTKRLARCTYATPEWCIRLGAKGKMIKIESWPPEIPGVWEPDFADPIFLEKHENFIRALAQRYDGHRDIDYLDLASLGRWGEWHTSEYPKAPPWEARKRIVDTYCDAFKKTPLLMLIADVQALEYAISRGTGWRADCLGDVRNDFFNDIPGIQKLWNHHEDVYLQRIVEANATKAWKTAPVAFETCWDMKYWKKQGWSIENIFYFALSMHVSIVNAKSVAVPEDWWPAVNDFSRRFGYRLVLRRVEHPTAAEAGTPFPVKMRWENKGVAPCYFPYRPAFRLRHHRNDAVRVVTAAADIRKWLPGAFPLEERVTVPADLPAGTYELSVAIVEPVSGTPAIQLAIEGGGKDGWYPLSELRIA